MEEFRKLISSFNDSSRTRKYEFAIAEKSKLIHQSQLSEYENAMHDKSESEFFRFSCFFLLFTYYRKNNLLTEMKELVDTNYDTFKSQFLFNFIYLMKEAKLSTVNQLDKLLEEGEKHLDFYKDYIGYLNLYAEICAKHYEVNLDLRGKINDKERRKRKVRKSTFGT